MSEEPKCLTVDGAKEILSMLASQPDPEDVHELEMKQLLECSMRSIIFLDNIVQEFIERYGHLPPED